MTTVFPSIHTYGTRWYTIRHVHAHTVSSPLAVTLWYEGRVSQARHCYFTQLYNCRGAVNTALSWHRFTTQIIHRSVVLLKVLRLLKMSFIEGWLHRLQLSDNHDDNKEKKKAGCEVSPHLRFDQFSAGNVFRVTFNAPKRKSKHLLVWDGRNVAEGFKRPELCCSGSDHKKSCLWVESEKDRSDDVIQHHRHRCNVRVGVTGAAGDAGHFGGRTCAAWASKKLICLSIIFQPSSTQG